MEPLKKMLPNSSPLHVAALNIPSKWEAIYDKYAPAMFGMIMKLTSDKALAENVLTEAFVSMKKNDLLSSAEYEKNALLCVLRHTYKSAVRVFEKNKFPFTLSQNLQQQNEIFWMICTEFQDLKTLSFKLGISETEARKKLFQAFIGFSTQNHAATFLA